ncbi:MAG: glycine--tRNA ligase [Candidatus Paceibacterota bacterium]
MSADLLEKIVSLAKRRGFVVQNSEIYGGLANSWDFGPLGVELKRNIKNLWWDEMVIKRDDVCGLDSAILMNPKVWEASGHLKSFTDPLVECKSCHYRFRADYLKEGKYGKVNFKNGKYFCPYCQGELTEERKFNLMFKTFLGPVEDLASTIYLRPETAQGIFVNFKYVLNVCRKKLPFGIAQIGKSFRNEITPSNFIFRIREFEQMELEYFVKPQEDEKWYHYWVNERFQWFKKLGIKKENLRLREHEKSELAHYAKACTDIEYHFPFGWGEIEGIANRQDFDLKSHQKYSQKELTYYDEDNKSFYFPYVIEPSSGVERTFLAVLCDAYTEEEDKEGTRIVLKLNKFLAPIKLAIFPLVKNNEKIREKAENLYRSLKNEVPFLIFYDEVGSIGRRYRRQDEIGTPFCITVDHQSLEDDSVTIRERDSMKQFRIKIGEIKDWVKNELLF